MPWTPLPRLKNEKAFNMLILGGLLKYRPDGSIGERHARIEEIRCPSVTIICADERRLPLRKEWRLYRKYKKLIH